MALRNQKFNLIEILISMIVIIFAMFIILSFIPLSEKQSREAQIMSQVSNFSDNFISYLKQQDSTDITNTFPLVTDYATSIGNVNSNKTEYDTLTNSNLGVSANDGWLNSNNTYLHINKNSRDGFFKITKATLINNAYAKDSEVELRAWRTSPTVRSSTDSSNSAVLSATHFNSLSSYKSSTDSDIIPFITRIHMEFSWPLNAPYADRTKVYSFYDINSL